MTQAARNRFEVVFRVVDGDAFFLLDLADDVLDLDFNDGPTVLFDEQSFEAEVFCFGVEGWNGFEVTDDRL